MTPYKNQYPTAPHLPGGQTGRAHQVSAGLDLHILVVLRADLTKLERGTHLTVELVLLLCGGRRCRAFRPNCSRQHDLIYIYNQAASAVDMLHTANLPSSSCARVHFVLEKTFIMYKNTNKARPE